MDEDMDRLMVGVRIDTRGFAQDVAAMRASLEGSLGEGADRAGTRIETSLLRAVRTGKLGFDDLQRTALSVLDAIAASAIKGGIASLLGGKGLGAALSGLIGGGGKAGRATGGPVAPGVGYLVGERGPELFVPTASGRVETMGGAMPGAAREIRVTINVQAAAGEAPAALQRSSRQVARAVKAALEA